MKISKDEHGHLLLDGGRWHRPSTKDPRKCVDEGCTYVMGTLRRDSTWKNEETPPPEPKFRRKRKS